MKIIFLAFCAALLLAGRAGAAQLTLALGGEAAGCPRQLIYDPALIELDPQGALAWGAPWAPGLLDTETITGIGSFKEPGTGLVWYAYASEGASCDPYFLFISSGPGGRQQVRVSGETLRFISARAFSVKQRFNLYFGIERRLGWAGGRPAEKRPDYYALSVKTRTLRPVPVAPAKGKPAGRLIPAKTNVTITGYDPGSVQRVLLKGPDGRAGWADLEINLFEGAVFAGD